MDPVARTPTSPTDYAALSAGYGSLLAAVLVAARERGEEPIAQSELPALGLATFQLAKLLTKEKVETWVREPFIEEDADGGKHPRGTGLRYAVGELLTCSRCTGAWASLGLTALRVTRPREARVVTSVLAAAAVNDFLQAGFSRLCAQTDLAQADAARSGSG